MQEGARNLGAPAVYPSPQRLLVDTPGKTAHLSGALIFLYEKTFQTIMFPLSTSGVLARVFWDSR